MESTESSWPTEEQKTCFIPLSIKEVTKIEQQQHKKTQERNFRSPEILGIPSGQRMNKTALVAKQEQENLV